MVFFKSNLHWQELYSRSTFEAYRATIILKGRLMKPSNQQSHIAPALSTPSFPIVSRGGGSDEWENGAGAWMECLRPVISS